MGNTPIDCFDCCASFHINVHVFHINGAIFFFGRTATKTMKHEHSSKSIYSSTACGTFLTCPPGSHRTIPRPNGLRRLGSNFTLSTHSITYVQTAISKYYGIVPYYNVSHSTEQRFGQTHEVIVTELSVVDQKTTSPY